MARGHPYRGRRAKNSIIGAFWSLCALGLMVGLIAIGVYGCLRWVNIMDRETSALPAGPAR